VARALGRIEEALQQQTDLARQWEAAGASSGYGFQELGEGLLAQGQPELAAPRIARLAQTSGTREISK
jgi:hypothetical protein